jgi:hypothetical protein
MPPIGLEGREGYAPLQRDRLFTWRARYRIPSRVNAMRRSVIDSHNWLEVSSVIRHPRWGQRLGVVSGRYAETLRAKVDTRSAGGGAANFTMGTSSGETGAQWGGHEDVLYTSRWDSSKQNQTGHCLVECWKDTRMELGRYLCGLCCCFYPPSLLFIQALLLFRYACHKHSPV